MDIIKEALKNRRTSLSEYESKMILHTYGIPTTREEIVSERQELTKAIQKIGFPLVLKASALDISHKTERGLVRVDIRDEKEAIIAFDDIMGQVEEKNGAVLVQEMVKGARELVVGLTRDNQFGPCVMFGLGGIFTEVLKDTSFRVLPIERRDALDMMQEIKANKILGPIRGMPAADLDQLADIIMNVGRIGLESDHVQEIDINPIILAGSKPIAVDALIVLTPTP
ncbi:MAG: acetate--CoA ligase family protein [Deltaproteobacteria bacterium]|nr:acetate--CoA ligase family protein [Deltaproteobacteria bacterium]